METLKLEKSTAKKLFKDAPEWFKKVLNDSFGKECFNGKIIDRVDSYEEAYELADDQTRKECEIFPTDTDDIVAYKMLKLIIKVVNEDFVPDFTNLNQKKWYPWFQVLPSGSGFDFSSTDYYFGHSGTTVGSRLCTETDEKCKHVATTFIKLYERFLLTK